jgi:hypothetical protein
MTSGRRNGCTEKAGQASQRASRKPFADRVGVGYTGTCMDGLECRPLDPEKCL